MTKGPKGGIIDYRSLGGLTLETDESGHSNGVHPKEENEIKGRRIF